MNTKSDIPHGPTQDMTPHMTPHRTPASRRPRTHERSVGVNLRLLHHAVHVLAELIAVHMQQPLDRNVGVPFILLP